MPPPNTPLLQTPPRVPSPGSPDVSLAVAIMAPPPNTPATAFNSPRSMRTRNPASLSRPIAEDSDANSHAEQDATHGIDYRGLTYIGTVNENLICPICKVALVDPVDTECSHTFCRECITRALSHKYICPIDRQPLVECTTCGDQLPRDCDEVLQEINIEQHQESTCKEREKHCEHCGAEMLRCKQAQHEIECPDVIDACKWAEYGCDHKSKRRNLGHHRDDCNFRFIGPMAERLRSEIQTLRSDVRHLTEKEQLQDRRIKFLEGGQRDNYRQMDYSEISTEELSTLAASAPAEPTSESTNDYLLNLLGDQERRINELSLALTELEGKQTMMLFNQTVPIKNQIAELQSNQQLTSMHIRWFMNWRKEDQQRMHQQQRRFGGGGGNDRDGRGDGGASSSEHTLPRRSSDSFTRDMTKL
ncbi:hypothetical protein B0O99DRAFT_589359 [Bisporella sp. PMI_857]|nr:hypothetical protein B0O99DRAFT_589359 [Bisporella sp. PMI_857]